MALPTPKAFWPITVSSGDLGKLWWTMAGSYGSRTIPAGIYYSFSDLLNAVRAAIPLSSAAVGPTGRVTLGTSTSGFMLESYPGSLPSLAFLAVGNAVQASAPVPATLGQMINWTGRGGTLSSVPVAIAWNGSIFCGVGYNLALISKPTLTSNDWTQQSIPAGDYRSIVWNGSLFCAVGNNCVATSSDGINWTARSIPNGLYCAVDWNGSLFCAVGYNCVATSSDGINWTARSIPSGYYQGMVWMGSRFVAVGNNCVATSSDGSGWTQRTIPSGTYRAAATDGLQVVAVGDSCAAISSDGGLTWSSTTISSGTYYGIAWCSAYFVAVGSSCSAILIGSSPTWFSVSIPAGDYYAVIHPVAETTQIDPRPSTPSIFELLGFSAGRSGWANSQIVTVKQHMNGWYAEDPVADDTLDLPVHERAQTAALSGKTKGLTFATRYRRQIDLEAMSDYKFQKALEGTAHGNEAIEHLIDDGWSRFRWWPDATDSATYQDYALDLETAKELKRNRVARGLARYNLSLKLRKYV